MDDQHAKHQPVDSSEASTTTRPRLRLSWRSLGLAGFLFFLIKGLLWLSVPLAIAAWRMLAS